MTSVVCNWREADVLARCSDCCYAGVNGDSQPCHIASGAHLGDGDRSVANIIKFLARTDKHNAGRSAVSATDE